MTQIAVQVEATKATFTGRCQKCGSANMWSEGNKFGCDSCGAQYCTEDSQPIHRLARRD